MKRYFDIENEMDYLPLESDKKGVVFDSILAGVLLLLFMVALVVLVSVV